MSCAVETPYTTRTLTAVDNTMRYDWRSDVFPVAAVDSIDAVTDPRNVVGNFVCISAYRLFKSRPDQAGGGTAFTGSAASGAQYLSESMATPAAQKMYAQVGVGYYSTSGVGSAEVGFTAAWRPCGLFGGAIPIHMVPGAANQAVYFPLGRFARRGVTQSRLAVVQLKAEGTGYVKTRLAARTFATDPMSPADWSLLESNWYNPSTRNYDDRCTADIDPSLGSNMWGELALAIMPTTADMNASLIVAWNLRQAHARVVAGERRIAGSERARARRAMDSALALFGGGRSGSTSRPEAGVGDLHRGLVARERARTRAALARERRQVAAAQALFDAASDPHFGVVAPERRAERSRDQQLMADRFVLVGHSRPRRACATATCGSVDIDGSTPDKAPPPVGDTFKIYSGTPQVQAIAQAYSSGNEAARECACLRAATLIFHEMTHTCVPEFADGGIGPGNCIGSYISASIFAWGLGQRYPLGTSSRCCNSFQATNFYDDTSAANLDLLCP